MQGLGASSLQWGAWGGSGMAAAEGPVLARLARLGLGAVQPEQGLTALQRVLHSMTVARVAGANLLIVCLSARSLALCCVQLQYNVRCHTGCTCDQVLPRPKRWRQCSSGSGC